MTSIGAEKMTQNTVGVDISKDWLDAHRLADQAERRFANTGAGRRALLKWSRGACVAFEPSGAYHRPLELALAQAGRPAFKVNPLRARRFAEAISNGAKTDRVDARLLARMAEIADRLELRPNAPPDETFQKIKELHVAFRALVKDRTAAKNRAKTLSSPLLQRQNAARLRQIEAHIAAIEAEIDALIESDARLAARRDILVSIPGVSTRTAVALIVEAPELGDLEARQAASLAGVAPIERQSGQSRGKARIRGGRAHLRQALYMPALVAARFNADLRRVYERLISAESRPRRRSPSTSRRERISRRMTRRPRGSGARSQHPTAKDPRLEDASRGAGRDPSIGSERPCCDDRLSPPIVVDLECDAWQMQRE